MPLGVGQNIFANSLFAEEFHFIAKVVLMPELPSKKTRKIAVEIGNPRRARLRTESLTNSGVYCCVVGCQKYISVVTFFGSFDILAPFLSFIRVVIPTTSFLVRN